MKLHLIDFIPLSFTIYILSHKKENLMNLRTKIWLVSQGMLLLTAFIIQITFYRGIEVGPILGTPKRPYWEIISGTEPVIPEDILSMGVDPEFYDDRIPVKPGQIESLNLRKNRLSARQEQGLRMALFGGLIVNLIYFFAFHILVRYFQKTIRNAQKREIV